MESTTQFNVTDGSYFLVIARNKEKHISNQLSLGSVQRRVNSTAETIPTSTESAAKHARGSAKNRRLNFTLITSHIAIVAVIVSVIAVGYRAPVEATQATDFSVLAEPSPSVDQIAAADVAVQAALAADISVGTQVASLAISLNTKTELAQTDNSIINKPQIVGQDTGRKGVSSYTVQAGDNVPSVAAAHSVSDDSIRWANNLASDNLTPGSAIKIPGTTGVVYTVKQGDTPDSLASKYQADKERIITYNDAELSGLQPGQQIVIPNGILPENERPGYVAPRSQRSTTSSSTAVTISPYGVAASSGNGYAYGYCTYYAYNRRAELGRPIGGNWGNAVSWSAYARAAGFLVDNTPEAGAVIQNGGGWGGYGHVGVVERVNPDGSLLVSDMNYAGWNVISNRTVPAGSVGSYNYIH